MTPLSLSLCPQQMDDAVYTFEQILHQALESQGTEDLCKTIQRCQDRVIKVKHTNRDRLLDYPSKPKPWDELDCTQLFQPTEATYTSFIFDQT